MSRTVSSSYSILIGGDTLRLAELYDITLRTGTTYYYTSAGADIAWNGYTYLALPITRDEINFNLNLEPDTVRVYLAGISGDLVDYVQANNLDHCEVTIRRVFRGTTYASDDEIILFTGSADVEFNRSLLILELRPWIDSLNIQVPKHTYQEPCNNVLFDAQCMLAQTSYGYASAATGGSKNTLTDTGRGLVYLVRFTGGDVQATIAKGDLATGSIGAGTAKVLNAAYEDDGSGRLWACELNGALFVDGESLLGSLGGTVTVSGTPEEYTAFYERGELEIRTGNNAGQRRPILSDSSYTVTVFWPFANDVAAGDSYTLYPGCDGRAAETCHSWFANDTNFNGFLYVPRIEETVL